MAIVQTDHRGAPIWRAIFISFAIAFLLMTIPVPDWAAAVRPDLVTVVLIAWCFTLPARVGVGVGWFTGLLLDALQFTVLGQNAISKGIVAYLAIRVQPRVRAVLIWQQMIVVVVLLCVDVALVSWIRGFFGDSPATYSIWLPVLIGALLWPFIFLGLQRFSPRLN